MPLILSYMHSPLTIRTKFATHCIGIPFPFARPLLITDVRWLIKTYEPRVDVNEVDLKDLLALQGNFRININAIVKG